MHTVTKGSLRKLVVFLLSFAVAAVVLVERADGKPRTRHVSGRILSQLVGRPCTSPVDKCSIRFHGTRMPTPSWFLGLRQDRLSRSTTSMSGPGHLGD